MIIGLVPESTSKVPEAGAAQHTERIIRSKFERRIQWTFADRLTPVAGQQRIKWADVREGEKENKKPKNKQKAKSLL
jgi:hypothetical protein